MIHTLVIHFTVTNTLEWSQLPLVQTKVRRMEGCQVEERVEVRRVNGEDQERVFITDVIVAGLTLKDTNGKWTQTVVHR
jgi:hypothetical protein